MATEPVTVPGEKNGRWHPGRGIGGIAVIETDKAFVDHLCRVLHERGIEITLATSKGGVTVRGKLRAGIVTDWLRAYIRTVRERALAEGGE